MEDDENSFVPAEEEESTPQDATEGAEGAEDPDEVAHRSLRPSVSLSSSLCL